MSHSHSHSHNVPCSYCSFPVGYAGQQYEVMYQDKETGEIKSFGWARRPQNMLSACQKMPSCERAWIVDLWAEVKKGVNKNG